MTESAETIARGMVRSGLRMILESEPQIEIVGEASDGAEAVALATTLAPDVICMDVQMPGMDGLEAIHLFCDGFEYHACPNKLSAMIGDDIALVALKADPATVKA